MKGGTIRRIASKFSDIFSEKKTHQYPDPVVSAHRVGMPHSKKPRARRGRKNDQRPVMRRGNLVAPKCDPGTITYHDKLVRHFGRRQADKYGRILNAGQLDLLPTEEDFANNPPWAFRSTGTGCGSTSDA
jgi:hypothetical protein